NSIFTTYRPRGSPFRTKEPFNAVATLNFLPVRVFAAVTVTPGRYVFPDRTRNLIRLRPRRWLLRAGWEHKKNQADQHKAHENNNPAHEPRHVPSAHGCFQFCCSCGLACGGASPAGFFPPSAPIRIIPISSILFHC